MPHRPEKVSSAIHKELAEQILTLELPAMVTISRVEVPADLKHAKVWITVLPAGKESEKAVLKSLEENIYELQGKLNHTLKMFKAPRISFVIDHSEEYASKINTILKKIETEEQDEET